MPHTTDFQTLIYLHIHTYIIYTYIHTYTHTCKPFLMLKSDYLLTTTTVLCLSVAATTATTTDSSTKTAQNFPTKFMIFNNNDFDEEFYYSSTGVPQNNPEIFGFIVRPRRSLPKSVYTLFPDFLESNIWLGECTPAYCILLRVDAVCVAVDSARLSVAGE
jgi:hypothetical protein